MTAHSLEVHSVEIPFPVHKMETTCSTSQSGHYEKDIQGLPRFVVTRGGEYCFLPGLRALRWLGDLKTP